MSTLIGTFVGIIVAAGLFLGLVYATRRKPPEPPAGLGTDPRVPGDQADAASR